MSDRYLDFANSGVGGWLTGALGLPRPTPLQRRAEAGAGLVGPLLLGPDGNGRLATILGRLAGAAGQKTHAAWSPDVRYGGLVFDASNCIDAASAQGLYRFFHQTIRSVAEHGRIVVIGTPPELMADAEGEAIQRGLEGFVRSLAKEARRSIAVHMLYVAPGARLLRKARWRFCCRRARPMSRASRSVSRRRSPRARRTRVTRDDAFWSPAPRAA